MTIDELIHATGAELVAGSPKHTFEGCVIDSRKAQEGSLFVAFKGEKVDASILVPQIGKMFAKNDYLMEIK